MSKLGMFFSPKGQKNLHFTSLKRSFPLLRGSPDLDNPISWAPRTQNGPREADAQRRHSKPQQLLALMGALPSRKLTYPTWGKGKSPSNMPYQGDMLIPWRVMTWVLICFTALPCNFPLRTFDEVDSLTSLRFLEALWTTLTDLVIEKVSPVPQYYLDFHCCITCIW